MKKSAKLYKNNLKNHPPVNISKEENSGEDENGDYVAFLPLSSENYCEGCREQLTSLMYYLRRAKDLLVEILKELWSPPSVAALMWFTVGAIDKLKSLVTEDVPLRVAQDSAKRLGDATIPCTVLILGGSLTKGIGRTVTKPLIAVSMVVSIIVIQFIIGEYRYVLLQYTVPPAMSIGTIAQLFDVGEEECSIIFLWTHLVAALALTLWSTVFMSLVS